MQAADCADLDRLELLERLAAVVAVADRAARRRAEEVLEARRHGAAVRAPEAVLELHQLEPGRGPRGRRSEPRGAELLPAGGRDVVGRPRVVEPDPDVRRPAELGDLLLEGVSHRLERGA